MFGLVGSGCGSHVFGTHHSCLTLSPVLGVVMVAIATHLLQRLIGGQTRHFERVRRVKWTWEGLSVWEGRCVEDNAKSEDEAGDEAKELIEKCYYERGKVGQ